MNILCILIWRSAKSEILAAIAAKKAMESPNRAYMVELLMLILFLLNKRTGGLL